MDDLESRIAAIRDTVIKQQLADLLWQVMALVAEREAWRERAATLNAELETLRTEPTMKAPPLRVVDGA